MTRLLLTLVAVSALLAALSGSAAAQITIQQPVVDVFSVGTTVSVPDRGRAFLGGVSSAGSSRAQFGPFRNGSSVGQFRDASSTSVSVSIHDFDEMDRALLSQAGRPGSVTASAPLAVDPYRDLFARNQRRGTSLATPLSEFAGARSVAVIVGARDFGANNVGARDFGSPRSAPGAGLVSNTGGQGGDAAGLGSSAVNLPEPPKMPADQAARSFDLARQAVSRGALSVARLHFKMAARHGHPEAEASLAELDARPAAPAISARASVGR